MLKFFKIFFKIFLFFYCHEGGVATQSPTHGAFSGTLSPFMLKGKFSPIEGYNMEILKQQEVFSGKDLINLGKQGDISESFTSSKTGEMFTKISGKLCYVSKAARADFNNCAVSNLSVVQITGKDDQTGEVSTFLRLQKAGADPQPKTGNWH